MHFLGVLQAKIHGFSDPLVDTTHDLVNEFFVCDAHRGVDELPREATVPFTLPLPVLPLAPVLQLLEEFEEEDAQVFGLLFRAQMDGGHDALEYLSKEREEVEVGHS